MPPYCERHDTFHTSGQCDAQKAREARERLAAIKERQAAERQAKAEQIAAAVIVAEHRRDGESFPRDWGDVQKIATAAALAALTDKENA